MSDTTDERSFAEPAPVGDLRNLDTPKGEATPHDARDVASNVEDKHSISSKEESRSQSRGSSNYDYSSDSDHQRTFSGDGSKELREPERITRTESNIKPPGKSKSPDQLSYKSRNSTKSPDQVSIGRDSVKSSNKHRNKSKSASPISSPTPMTDKISTPSPKPPSTSPEAEPKQENKKKAHFEQDSTSDVIYEDDFEEDFLFTSKKQNSNINLVSESKRPVQRQLDNRASNKGSSESARHYTTMGVTDEVTQNNKLDSVSVHSTSSKTSGFLSILGYMTEKFIYETDPFESALQQCPKVTFHVVDKAISPVSIEILFGNPERRSLPSYYYTSTEKNSARSRRGTSGSGRPGGPVDLGHRDDSSEMDVETRSHGRTSSHGSKSPRRSPPRDGNLPNIKVSDHSQSYVKRPVTSSSTKTTKSLGLPGRPMRST